MRKPLVLEEVYKRYGDRTVIAGISLTVEAGAIVALLGASGAGKSTTMKLCAGFVAADDGSIRVSGEDMIASPEAARRRLAYLPENVVLYDELTGRENLSCLLELATGRRTGKNAVSEALTTAGLPPEAIDRRAATYSKGMRQKVGLALALAKGAGLLLLDEPTSGLDPRSAADFNAAMRSTAQQGVGILMATHDIWRVKEVATSIVILSGGRIVADLNPANLSAEDIERRFLIEAGAA